MVVFNMLEVWFCSKIYILNIHVMRCSRNSTYNPLAIWRAVVTSLFVVVVIVITIKAIIHLLFIITNLGQGVRDPWEVQEVGGGRK